jgi:hypothetical protein
MRGQNLARYCLSYVSGGPGLTHPLYHLALRSCGSDLALARSLCVLLRAYYADVRFGHGISADNLHLDDFQARSPDELSLAKGDRVQLVERDDDFGDGWYLGKHLMNGNTGLFPEGKRPRPAIST